MGKESIGFSEAYSREQNGNCQSAITIGYAKANMDDHRGTVDSPFIGYRGGRAPKRLHEAFALGLVGNAITP